MSQKTEIAFSTPFFGFRHLNGIPGIGGIARIRIENQPWFVLYGVRAELEPDRHLVFESLDDTWLAPPGGVLRAAELPRGWPDRAAITRLTPELPVDGGRPIWRPTPATAHETHAIVEGLRLIGLFDPDHPENGGRPPGPAPSSQRSAKILRFVRGARAQPLDVGR